MQNRKIIFNDDELKLLEKFVSIVDPDKKVLKSTDETISQTKKLIMSKKKTSIIYDNNVNQK